SSTGSGGKGAAEERPARTSRAIPERKANERHEVLRVIRRSCMGGTFTAIPGRTVTDAGRRRLCHLEYDAKRAIIPVCTLVQRRGFSAADALPGRLVRTGRFTHACVAGFSSALLKAALPASIEFREIPSIAGAAGRICAFH